MGKMLQTVWIPKARPLNNILTKCVGCGVEVTPGTCRTGSVIGNLQHFSIQGTDVAPIYGEIECLGNVVRFVHRLDEILTTRRVAFHKRHKGYLCDRCCANYKTLKQVNKSGETVYHPIVKVDRNESFLKPLEERIYDSRKVVDTSICDVETPSDAPVDVKCYNAFAHKETRQQKQREIISEPAPIKEYKGSYGQQWAGRRS